MSFVMSLDVKIVAELIVKAFEKELEEKLWQKWLAELPNMNKDTFVSFEKYKENHLKPQVSISLRTDEEILQDAENILKLMNKPKK